MGHMASAAFFFLFLLVSALLRLQGGWFLLLLLLLLLLFLLLFFFFFFFFFFFIYNSTTSTYTSSSSSSSSKYAIIMKVLLCGLVPTPISSLIAFYNNRHRLLDWYTHLLSQSPTMTITLHRLGAPRTIVTANPLNVQYILKDNFSNFPKGQPFTDLLGDFLGRGIFNADGHVWTLQRKLASHEFTTRSLREFVVTILQDQLHNRFIPILQQAADDNITLDMQDVLRRFTFDTICRVSIGIDPCCCLDLSKPAPELATAFDAASGISAMRGTAPIAGVWKLKRLLNIGMEKDLKEAVKVVHGCVEEMIKVKKESMMANTGSSSKDLLSRFIEAGIEDEIVRDMVISFLMAGRDTTSAAVTWLLWVMTQHGEIEKKAVEEIRSIIIIRSNKLNRSNEEWMMGFEDVKEMNYMTACLKESMRLYPPVVWDSKHAAEDDILPDGTVVKKGNRVTYFQYGMGRMERVWGKDWMEFQPERWMDNGGDLKKVSPYKYPVFQGGPRVCLGMDMAFLQMKYMMAAILSHFELHQHSNSPPCFVPLLTAHMAGGFNVTVRRRPPSPIPHTSS